MMLIISQVVAFTADAGIILRKMGKNNENIALLIKTDEIKADLVEELLHEEALRKERKRQIRRRNQGKLKQAEFNLKQKHQNEAARKQAKMDEKSP